MDTTYLEAKGILCIPSALQLPRARAMHDTLSADQLPFLKFVECRQHTEADGTVAETIVFDVDVERPQQLVHNIRREERIAVTFQSSDEWYPEVAALRRDFPQVPHLNHRAEEFPRSLCLYEEPWPHVAIRWTAANFFARIREWLSETAKGTLHQDDQPLEPLLMGSGLTIVLPPDLFGCKQAGEAEKLFVGWATAEDDCRVLLASPNEASGGSKFLALSFIANPQTHGAIRRSPKNLHELHEFVAPAGIALIDTLRDKFPDWNKKDFLSKRLLLIIAFPLRREEGETVEASNSWVFLTSRDIEEIGVDIGIWQKTDHGLGLIHLNRDPARNGHNIPLQIVAPVFDISPTYVAAASKVQTDDRCVFAVGAGALGSQVIKCLNSTGFGKWHVVDNDILLPHNLVRHELGRWAIGCPKAQAVAFDIHQLLTANEAPGWTSADILRPHDKAAELTAAIEKADLVLDMAADVAVSRYLTHDARSDSRRAALFLNPRGTDLVLLVEDRARSLTLDCLEMQYYRAVSTLPDLAGHLDPPAGRIRYSRSCRDVSSSIPADLVRLHSALGARAIRSAVNKDTPTIHVWRCHEETSEVRLVNIPVSKSHHQSIAGWTLVLDAELLERLTELRQRKLPVETGGVLIGSYDLIRKRVYVIDTIPSPPDSEEWPTLYIRGSQGLAAQVEAISQATNHQLEYVGEWHSHPNGCACLPSDDDLKVFGWLTTNMSTAGLPALMAIVGQNGISAWYLGQMLRTGGWEVPSKPARAWPDRSETQEALR